MASLTVYGMRDERPCTIVWEDGALSGRRDAIAALVALARAREGEYEMTHPEGGVAPVGLDTYESAFVTVPLAFDWISEVDGRVPEADTADIPDDDEETDVTLSEWVHPRAFVFDPRKHPRWPKGTPGGLGGDFKSSASAAKLSKLTGVPAADLLKDPKLATAGRATRKTGPARKGPTLPPIKDPKSKGAITTSDPRQAAQLLAQGHAVNLKQPREVSVLLEELARIVDDAVAKGDKAPDYDLCKVTVKNTSLFCVESKGIPRIQMPQLKGKPVEGSAAYKRKKNPADPDEEVDLTADFIKHLNAKGYKTRSDTEHAAYLKPSQNELSGVKVAGMVKWMRGGGDPNKNSSMLVTEDNYIVDGHHRWAATIGIDAKDNVLGNDKTLDVTRVSMDIMELLAEAVDYANANGIENQGFGAKPPA